MVQQKNYGIIVPPAMYHGYLVTAAMFLVLPACYPYRASSVDNRIPSEATLVSPAMYLSFFQRAKVEKKSFAIKWLRRFSTEPNLLLIFF